MAPMVLIGTGTRTMPVRGEGAVKPPPLTESDLAEIWQSAEAAQDKQHRTDLYRLLIVVRALIVTPGLADNTPRIWHMLAEYPRYGRTSSASPVAVWVP